MISLEPCDGGVIVSVRVQAQARRTGIVGVRDGALRVAVTAAPEKGKANRAVQEVLAETLGVAKSAVELVSGQTNSSKRFRVAGITASAAEKLLADCLADLQD